MSIFERHPKDHVGKWFEQRRKLGICDTVYWGRYTPEKNDLKMQEFQHAHGDGMSIMKHMLTESGHSDVTIPLCRETGLPTKEQLKKIKAGLTPYPKKVKWLFWQENNKLKNNSLETLFFSKQDTQQIEARSKSLGVPLTTLVLWALNRSVAKNLMQPSQEYSWFYPVNLRGAVDYGTDYANYSSGFYVPLNEEISVQALNEKIRNKLKSGEHWFNWQQAKISRYLPNAVIRWLYKFISNRQFYAGNFSAMGEWFNPNDERDVASQAHLKEDLSKERWFCCAPGTKNYPISSCMMIWNGQLSLTLKLHPSIVKNEHVALDTLCAWGETLTEEGISPVEAKKDNRVVSYHYSVE